MAQYDAKPEGFKPGGASLHNCMVPHGPDAEAFERASSAALAPHKLDHTLAFMFESRWRFHLTEWAQRAGARDAELRRLLGRLAGPLQGLNMLDHTHDAALAQLGRIGQRAGQRLPGAEPALRRLPALGARRAAAHRRGHRRPDARPETGARAMPLGPGHRRAAGAAGRGRAEAADGGGGRPRGARCAARCRRRWPRAATRAVPRAVPGAAAQVQMAAALRHRRLHRLLHRHPPRHRGGQAVPPRQPAAAQLQVGADRLPRPRLQHRRQRRRASCGPMGQSLPPAPSAPRFGPCQRLDYELELGVFVGAGNAQGQPMGMAQAEDDWFGIVLLNDWSARDIQTWEYQPLGPVPGEELRHHDLAVDRHARGAGAVPRALRRGRPATRSRCPTWTRAAQPRARPDRHRAAGAAADGGDARQGSAAARD